jgi:hypothetical protein
MDYLMCHIKKICFYVTLQLNFGKNVGKNALSDTEIEDNVSLHRMGRALCFGQK